MQSIGHKVLREYQPFWPKNVWLWWEWIPHLILNMCEAYLPRNRFPYLPNKILWLKNFWRICGAGSVSTAILPISELKSGKPGILEQKRASASMRFQNWQLESYFKLHLHLFSFVNSTNHHHIKTLPEAQRTQAIESKTWIISTTKTKKKIQFQHF